MNLDLTDIEFSAIRQMIAARIGLNFPFDGWGILKYRLSGAAEEAEFRDLRGFVHWLLSSRINQEQIKLLAHHLTIPETYFWREPFVFAALDQSILKELVNLRNESDKCINVWCAGCSTGEEAYSLAIALVRAIPLIKDWKISILATDINPISLEKAKEGIYRSWSFRNSPFWLRDLYFIRRNSKEYEIIPEIREMVTFSYFNLTHPNFLSTICHNTRMDMIFCRNVLMYLTKELTARVTQNFYDSLLEGGWLAVSSCELSTDLYEHFSPVNFPGAILYRKPQVELSASVKQLNTKGDQVPDNIIPAITSRNEALWQLSLDSDSDITIRQKNASFGSKKHVSAYNGITDSMDQITRLRIREDIIKENKISISLLTSQGHLEEALLICNEAIESDKLARGLYFMKSIILQEMDNNIEAIKSLKQAIFIDPDYLIGHFTLGNLFKSVGNIKNARLHFNNALKLLNRIQNDDIPDESSGISTDYMRKTILGNLQINMAV